MEKERLDGERLLCTGEVANFLGVSQSTVCNYIARGLLVPDLVMSTTRDGKSGRRKFELETVRQFISNYATSEYLGGKLYGTGEAAKFLGVSRSSIQFYVTTGRLKPDVVFPATASGHVGSQKFKRKTLASFMESYFGHKMESVS